MNSPEIIAERAAEKRRLNPDNQPSLAELKAVDAVLVARVRKIWPKSSVRFFVAVASAYGIALPDLLGCREFVFCLHETDQGTTGLSRCAPPSPSHHA